MVTDSDEIEEQLEKLNVIVNKVTELPKVVDEKLDEPTIIKFKSGNELDITEQEKEFKEEFSDEEWNEM